MTTVEKQELEYLRYYHDAVIPALGPADDDIISMIQDDYKEETGNPIPEEYNRNPDED